MQSHLSAPRTLRIHPSSSETTLSFQRSRDRLSIAFPIMFAGARCIGEGTVLNLSAEGCLLEGERAVMKGSYLTVRLLLPDNAPALVIDLAAVRWVHTHYLGLEFLRLPALERDRLEQFLTSYRR